MESYDEAGIVYPALRLGAEEGELLQAVGGCWKPLLLLGAGPYTSHQFFQLDFKPPLSPLWRRLSP